MRKQFTFIATADRGPSKIIGNELKVLGCTQNSRTYEWTTPAVIVGSTMHKRIESLVNILDVNMIEAQGAEIGKESRKEIQI